MRLSAVLALVLGCGTPDVEIAQSRTAVVQWFDMGTEEPAGVAPGFNLDGFVSDERDDRSCFKKDFVDEDGRDGIDNQMAHLVPLIEIASEGALQGLIQGSINEGRLLVFMQVNERVDGSYELRVMRGDDVPLLGTDGFLLPGQTLGLHEKFMLGQTANATLEDGVLRAGPFEVEVPVVVFNRLYVLGLTDALIRFEVGEDGSLKKGTIGGAATVEQLLEIIRTAGEAADDDLEGLLGGALLDFADFSLGPDRKCSALSMAVTFEATSAFIFE